MDPQRIHAALARIEDASERIATCVRDRPPTDADAELMQRHQRLCEEAGAALADLDQLIVELER